MTNLDAAKNWFRSSIDYIMKIYSGLAREDIFLGISRNNVLCYCSCDYLPVIWALDTPNYASFVSHDHQDGQVGSLQRRFTLTSLLNELRLHRLILMCSHQLALDDNGASARPRVQRNLWSFQMGLFNER